MQGHRTAGKSTLSEHRKCGLFSGNLCHTNPGTVSYTAAFQHHTLLTLPYTHAVVHFANSMMFMCSVLYSDALQFLKIDFNLVKEVLLS